MQYREYSLAPPDHDLEQLSDSGRKFSPRIWNLQAVQTGLANGALEIELSTKASDQVLLELGYRSNHLKGFFASLERHHYLCSEWSYIASEPKINGMSVSYACDVYSMGFNKGLMKQVEKMRPYVYCKFTVKEDAKKVLVATMHPERDLADRSRR